MRTIIITVLAMVFSGSIFAQNIIQNHLKDYQVQDDVVKVHVTGKMFQLAAYIDNEDNDPDVEEFKSFAQTINEFHMIVADEVKDAKNKFNYANTKVSASHEELMRVEDKDGSFVFYIVESKGKVSELAMVGMSNDKFMAFSLTGNMDLRQISRLSNKLQNSGLDHAGKLFENGVHELKVYPNPAPLNGSFKVDIPEELQTGKATLIDMNGRRVKTNTLNGTSLQFETSGLPAGTYILEVKNDKASIKRKVVLQ